MRFARPLSAGTLILRYKRFLADVLLDSGETVTAHCPNPGSMLSVAAPGARVWLAKADGAKNRVLSYTWELVSVGDCLVGINTARPNVMVMEALAAGTIPELAGYASVRREVRYGRNCRIDLLLESAGRPTCLVEVKNVTMKRGLAPYDPVEFPDAVTARGTKHLIELAEAVQLGQRAVMLFVAHRSDAVRLSFASDIDAAYARALEAAARAGVEMLCYRCHVDTEGAQLTGMIPIELPVPAPA